MNILDFSIGLFLAVIISSLCYLGMFRIGEYMKKSAKV